ncbi:MAG: rhomboid family intramembrane serine protease [Gammaproteobacteria bacterium]
MLFIPFGADFIHKRIPIITLFICLLCLSVFYSQQANQKQVISASENFCNEQGSTLWRMVLKSTQKEVSQGACLDMMWKIHLTDNSDKVIKGFSEKGHAIAGLKKQADSTFKYKIISERYTQFTKNVPTYDTQELWYNPESWDTWKMLTAAFAHSSWMHVIGNLFFFFAFAVTLEMILGSITFSAIILTLALGTHSFYSLAMMGQPDPLPTVGLSGVVMGVLALFTWFLPSGRIKCFLWFIVIFRVVLIPAWLFVAWYIGWDVYTLLVLSDDGSGVNLVAHVSGAGISYLLGAVFFGKKRRIIRQEDAFA